MKWLAALLLTPVAGLAQVLYMPNQGGGEIVLTTRVCTYQGKTYEGLREAYTWTANTGKIEGCWTIRDGNVEIIFQSGRTMIYKIEHFSRRD